MFEMASPSSTSLGYVLKDHNCPNHTSLDSNSRLPPTYSSKSHSQCPSKPLKSNLKEPTNENRLVDEKKTPSYKVSNQRRNYTSHHNNQDDVPPPSPLMSRRQARVLDQWAAQQARETITTIERKKSSEFDISTISESNYVSFRSRPTSRETSPSPSDSSVSSLVQKWREFEISDVKQPPNNSIYHSQYEGGNSGACSIHVSRANSTSSSLAPSEQENESLNNWELEQTYTIDNYNNTCDINGGYKDLEKDKIRVVDIIKKLPLVECEKANTVCSPTVLSSPRIRGRQAVVALFAKQERDRYSEIEATSKRQAVSKFPKRGPLQTMLKLRALRREVSSQDQSVQQSPRVYEPNKLKLKSRASSSSSINNIRAKFCSALSECDDSLKTIHTDQDDKLTTTNSVVEGDLASNQPLQTTKANNNKSDQEEKSSYQFDMLTSNHKKINQVEIINTKKASLKSKKQEEEKEEKGDMEKRCHMSSFEDLVPQNTILQDMDEKEHVQPKIILSSDIVCLETKNCDELVNSIPLETNNVSSFVGWEDQRICEEEEGVYDDYNFCGPYLDWINDVSKPRSYWESLRQAWYAEIFTSSSKNEIRQLIERGSVSNVLASDFPEKMDKIMISSCTRHQAKSGGYDGEEESRLQVDFIHNKMKPLGIHLEEKKYDHNELQEHHFIVEEAIKNFEEIIEGSEQEVARENDVEENEEEVEEDPESSSSNQYNNGGFYEDQAQASSSLLPWTNYDNQEESDNSEQFEPTPHQEQSSITNSFDQDTQGGSSSCKNNSSIEMELIYDFRAHMEQMYREISELRMSVNSCVDMQAKLQSSIKDEVSAILSHSGSKKTKRKESNYKAYEKGCCCICYEKKADSVLYRCGHMCACFKCAHELQFSSGKCPICRAQIVDVVRVYTEDA